MKRAFEKTWNQKLEDAAPEELLPGFNVAAGWRQLDARLRPERKTFFIGWWRYAAAVLVGLLAGGYVMYQYARPAKDDAVLVRQQPKPVAAPARSFTAPQPAVIVQSSAATAAPPATYAGVSVASRKAVAVPLTPPVTSAGRKTVADTQVPRNDVAATPSPIAPENVISMPDDQRPIHLLDIDNEDKTAFLREPPPPVSDIKRIFLRFGVTPSKAFVKTDNDPASFFQLLKKH